MIKKYDISEVEKVIDDFPIGSEIAEYVYRMTCSGDKTFNRLLNKAVSKMDYDQYILFCETYPLYHVVPSLKVSVVLHKMGKSDLIFHDKDYLFMDDDRFLYDDEVRKLTHEEQDYVFHELCKEIDEKKYGYLAIQDFMYKTDNRLKNKAFLFIVKQWKRGQSATLMLDGLTLTDEVKKEIIDLSKVDNEIVNEYKYDLLKFFCDVPEIKELFSDIYETKKEKVLAAWEHDTSFVGIGKIGHQPNDDKFVKMLFDDIKDKLNNVDEHLERFLTDANKMYLEKQIMFFWTHMFLNFGKQFTITTYDVAHLELIQSPITIHFTLRNKEQPYWFYDEELRDAIILASSRNHKITFDEYYKPIIEKLFKDGDITKEQYDYVTPKQQKRMRKINHL